MLGMPLAEGHQIHCIEAHRMLMALPHARLKLLEDIAVMGAVREEIPICP
jgi:hypothetical protein